MPPCHSPTTGVASQPGSFLGRGVKGQKISVVIPAYNEGSIIRGSIRVLEDDLKQLNLGYEILVVDDGSTDDTCEKINMAAKESGGRVRLIHYGENRGKGFAFREGYRASMEDYVLLRDADLVVPKGLIIKYLEKIGGADVVIASKRHPESEVDYGYYRRFISKVFNLIVNALFNLNLSDSQCGFKLFKREALDEVMPRLLLKRYAFDVELLVNLKNRGFKIVEAPIVLKNLRERFMKVGEMFRMAIDLLALFYRLHLTGTYK